MCVLLLLLDIDECQASALNDCNTNATCVNLPGSYDCVCNDGFYGSGTVCLGIIFII